MSGGLTLLSLVALFEALVLSELTEIIILAVYPEMKTVLRTYHPIPSMQIDEYTKKNVQDAPRMKSQLKGCVIPQEEQNMPVSLAEVVRRGASLR